MQVEHKTEKGTVLFVKVPEKSTGYKMGLILLTFDVNYGLGKVFYDIPMGFNLIGLTSDITEEQAKMMVGTVKPFGCKGTYFKEYNNTRPFYATAIQSFKSIMQHLQVYEVNPYQEPKRGVSGGNLESELEYHTTERRTGKWVVLFKPN